MLANIDLTEDEVNFLLSSLSLRESILKQMLSAARQANDTSNFNFFTAERKNVASILNKVHVARHRAN